MDMKAERVSCTFSITLVASYNGVTNKSRRAGNPVPACMMRQGSCGCSAAGGVDANTEAEAEDHGPDGDQGLRMVGTLLDRAWDTRSLLGTSTDWLRCWGGSGR
jgi:hypothetical protein